MKTYRDQYQRVMKNWERMLELVNTTDTAQIAYLKDKLSAARAVVERRQAMAEAAAFEEMGWRMSVGVAAVAGFDLVDPDHSCTCGERRMDWLIWLSDGINVKCHTCGAIFRPGG